MSNLERRMLVQKVTLTIAFNPAKHDAPICWDWHDLIGVERDCQLIDECAEDAATPTPTQEEQILEWDRDGADVDDASPESDPSAATVARAV